MKTVRIVKPAVSGISTSATRYLSMAGGNWEATEANTQTPIARDGVISDLEFRTNTSISSGSYAFTLRLNGADTALTGTIQTGVPVTTSGATVAVVKGDLLNWAIVPTGTPTTLGATELGYTFEGDEAGKSVLFALIGAGTTQTYTAPCLSLGSGTEANVQVPMPTDGAIHRLCVKLTAAPAGSATRTITFRIGGSNTTLTVAFASGDTYKEVDLGGSSIALAAGDVVSILSAVSAPAPASSAILIGLDWDPTTDGEGVHMAAFVNPSQTVTTYLSPQGGVSSTSEANARGRVSVDCEARKLVGRLTTVPGVGKSRTLVMREGGADQALALSFGDADSTASDNDPISLLAGDFVGFVTVPTGTPDNAVLSYGFVTFIDPGTPPPAAASGSNFMLMGV